MYSGKLIYWGTQLVAYMKFEYNKENYYLDLKVSQIYTYFRTKYRYCSSCSRIVKYEIYSREVLSRKSVQVKLNSKMSRSVGMALYRTVD